MSFTELKDSDLLQYQQLPFEYFFSVDIAIKKLRPDADYLLEGTTFTKWQDPQGNPAPSWEEIVDQVENDKLKADAWLKSQS